MGPKDKGRRSTAKPAPQKPPGSTWSGSFVVMRKKRITKEYGEWRGPQKRRCRYRRCGKVFLATRWWHEFCLPSHKVREHQLEQAEKRHELRDELHRAIDVALGED